MKRSGFALIDRLVAAIRVFVAIMAFAVAAIFCLAG